MKEWMYIVIAIGGFLLWISLQNKFLEENKSDTASMVFPIVVPFISSILAALYYFIRSKGISEQSASDLFTLGNILLFILSAAGLTFAYLATSIYLKFEAGLLYSVFVSLGITICVTLFSFKKDFSVVKSFGLVLALISIVLMNWGKISPVLINWQQNKFATIAHKEKEDLKINYEQH